MLEIMDSSPELTPLEDAYSAPVASTSTVSSSGCGSDPLASASTVNSTGCGSVPLASASTVSSTGCGCSLLTNRVQVYPRRPDLVLPEGATVLPFSDDVWVAVSLPTLNH